MLYCGQDAPREIGRRTTRGWSLPGFRAGCAHAPGFGRPAPLPTLDEMPPSDSAVSGAAITGRLRFAPCEARWMSPERDSELNPPRHNRCVCWTMPARRGRPCHGLRLVLNGWCARVRQSRRGQAERPACTAFWASLPRCRSAGHRVISAASRQRGANRVDTRVRPGGEVCWPHWLVPGTTQTRRHRAAQ